LRSTRTSYSATFSLSLHDALPICADLLHRPSWHVRPVHRTTVIGWKREMDAGQRRHRAAGAKQADALPAFGQHGREIGKGAARADRKSTRLNSSHVANSYAVFCLK